MALACGAGCPRRVHCVRDTLGAVMAVRSPRKIVERRRGCTGKPERRPLAETGRIRRPAPTCTGTFGPCARVLRCVVCAVDRGVRKPGQRRDTFRLPALSNHRRPARNEPRHPALHRGRTMSNRTFDTLGTVHDLEATGIERPQAEAIAQAIGRNDEQLATKSVIRASGSAECDEERHRASGSAECDEERHRASGSADRDRRATSSVWKRRSRRKPTGPSSTAPSGFRAGASSPFSLP